MRPAFKFLLLLTAVFTIAGTGSAQKINYRLSGGLQGSILAGYAFITPIVRPFARVDAEKNFGKATVAVGLEYSMKGFTTRWSAWWWNGDTIETVVHKERFHYVAIPITAHYTIGKMRFGTGLYAAYNVYDHRKYDQTLMISNGQVERTFESGRIPSEWYRNFSLGMEVDISYLLGRSAITLTYASDITDLEKPGEEGVVLNTLLRLGYGFRLTK